MSRNDLGAFCCWGMTFHSPLSFCTMINNIGDGLLRQLGPKETTTISGPLLTHMWPWTKNKLVLSYCTLEVCYSNLTYPVLTGYSIWSLLNDFGFNVFLRVRRPFMSAGLSLVFVCSLFHCNPQTSFYFWRSWLLKGLLPCSRGRQTTGLLARSGYHLF